MSGHRPAPNWSDFQRRLEAHYSNFPILPASLPENRDRLETLKRDGLVFIPDLLSG
jgi:hypothetical protein